VPLYPAIPQYHKFNQAAPPNATFYADLRVLIEDENPYGTTIFAPDITTPFGNLPADRANKVNALKAAGVRIMGWLRYFWSVQPQVKSSNDRMTVSEKQQCFHWQTMYDEEGTTRFPNVSPSASTGFVPIADAYFDVNEPNPAILNKLIQNCPDFEINQVTKALFVPFEYETTDPTPRRLKAAILIGYVGTGGGQ
jgi:hypothetical protein